MPCKKKQLFLFRLYPQFDIALAAIKENSPTMTWMGIARRMEDRIRKEWPNLGIKEFPTGKQCRERWVDHLDRSVSRAPFTSEEKAYIKLSIESGDGYSKIGKELNHTANQVKNWYCTYGKKERAEQNLKMDEPSRSGSESGQHALTFGFFSVPNSPEYSPGLNEFAQELLEIVPTL